MYTLIIEDRLGRSASEISFDQGNYTIGRVDGNDVVLPSSSVSRSHARIFVSNNKCYIDDLDSANGVQVDGIQIKERTEIKNGSKIRIGEYTLYLEYKDQSDMNSGQEILKTQIVSGQQSGFKIVRVGDNFAGEEFMLTETSNTIGRTEDNYILLSDGSISRNHAKIININMTFKVVDLNSSNGTFVNNRRLVGEQILQSGDLVRFGNINFVFCPASQKIDVSLYAKRNTSNKLPIILAIIFAVTVLAIAAVFIIHTKTKQDDKAQQPVAENVSKEDVQAKLDSSIKRAQQYIDDKNFTSALELIEPLLTEHKDNAELTKLSNTIHFELDNEKALKSAKVILEGRDLEAKDYDKAIEAFKKIPKESALFADAEEKIKDTEHKKIVLAYNNARAQCDKSLNADCINHLCSAVLKLDPEIDKAKIDDSVAYVERLTRDKKKLGQAAKSCHKKLAAFSKN